MFKNIFLIISLISVFITSLTGSNIIINSSNEYYLDLSVSLPELNIIEKNMKDGNIYVSIIVPGAGSVPPGKPDIPAFGLWILIPNSTNIDVQVNPGKPEIFDEINLAPVQPSTMDYADAPEPEFTKDLSTYNTYADYPGIFAETENRMEKRGQDCTILWIYPYQYHPVEKRLSVYPDLQVSINFTGNIQPIPANLRNTIPEIYSFALNSETVLAAEKQAESDFSEPLTRIEGCDLLIISHPLFENAANTLASWKKRKGFHTKVVTTDITGNQAESIDQYIVDAFYNWDIAPSYLILLGDAEYVHTQYITIHPATDYNQGYTASDLYYADINQPADLIADMGYGRIPVNTPAQADSIIARIIRYEKEPPELLNFYQNMTAVCYFQDNGFGYAERRFAKTSEDVRNFLTENFYNVERIYYTEPHNDPQYWNVGDYVFENDISGGPLPFELLKPGFPWDGNAFDIQNAIETGSFFVLHRDHGYRLGWGDPAYSIYDVQNLDNGELRPVVWTINCNTGWFDNETDANECGTAYASECFVEYFLNHDTGGSIGLLGSTRISYSGNNDRLVWGFMDAIWPDFLEWCTATYPAHYPMYKMGDVTNFGKEYMMINYTWGNEIRLTSIEEFQWFGDPTMEIWTEYPATLEVSHDPEIELGSSSFQVNCDVDGACVSLVFNDELIGRGTIFNGSTTITFQPIIEVGILKIGVSKHNYIPYLAEIDVAPTGPYVICEDVSFEETGEHIDGSIQSLDIINMDITLNNIGIAATGEEMLVTLSTTSFFVSTIIDSIIIGSIPAENSITIEDAFLIELSQGIPDNSEIDFTIVMSSDEEEWQYEFNLLVHAPVLEFVNFEMNIISGEDQVLDPGETAELFITYNNIGSGYAYNIYTYLFSNDPYVLLSGSDNIPQLNPGDQASTILPIFAEVIPSCPIDYYIEISILALDEMGSSLTASFSIPVGILEYTFDNNAVLWEHDIVEEDYLDQWHLSSYRNHTENGIYSMKCGGEDGEYYVNDVFAALYTPVFIVTSNTYMRFHHWMETGILGTNQSWDGGIIEISVNGSEFEQIEPVGGYPATIMNIPTFPFEPGTPVFAGEIVWEEAEFDLSDYPGTAQLRFVFGTSPTMYTKEGWYIDDVQIVSYVDADNETVIPFETQLYQNYPNPFNPSGAGRSPETTIRFTTEDVGLRQTTPGQVENTELIIYNVKGQKVRQFSIDNGQSSIQWNGTDENNKPVSSGIYFYQLKIDNKPFATRKMILLR